MSEAEVQALATQGDASAQYELATRLLMGQDKGPDAKAAAGWLEKAANQGFALAQLRLGILYGKGLGVNRDYALARKWFQAAAERGNALAMHNLAVLLSEGHGRKPDYAAANAWFRKAAELGVMDSQYNLGLDYMQGLGVERDLVQSYAWFAAAAAAGDAKASKKRKEIAALLDPEELDAARALADRLSRNKLRRKPMTEALVDRAAGRRFVIAVGAQLGVAPSFFQAQAFLTHGRVCDRLCDGRRPLRPTRPYL